MTAVADQLWEDAGAPLLAEWFGVSVTYCRRSEQTAAFTAMVLDGNYALADAQGATTVLTQRTYEIKDSDLVLNGAAIQPLKGDTIKETIGGEERTFEIQPTAIHPAVQELHGGLRWVVRTKRVA